MLVDPPDLTPLGNIVWRAFTGPQQQCATGTGSVRRFAPGYSPVVAFENPADPNLQELNDLLSIGEQVYVSGWSGPVPQNIQIVREVEMLQMVWDGRELPEEPNLPGTRALTEEDAAEAVALADMTRPGPFGPKTLTLGDYYGIFEGDQLISMAGERFHVGNLREISGVCTHPEHQGRGLAKSLMKRLIRQAMNRGERSFLHVVATNEGAIGLYRKMGFEEYQRRHLRIISRNS